MNKIKELWGKVKSLYKKYRNWIIVFVIGAFFGAFILNPLLTP